MNMTTNRISQETPRIAHSLILQWAKDALASASNKCVHRDKPRQLPIESNHHSSRNSEPESLMCCWTHVDGPSSSTSVQHQLVAWEVVDLRSQIHVSLQYILLDSATSLDLPDRSGYL